MTSLTKVEIRGSTGKGQGLFATCDIKTGENILQETPIREFDDATLQHFAGYDAHLEPVIRVAMVFQRSALPIDGGNEGHVMMARKSLPGAVRANANNLPTGGDGQRLAARKIAPSTAINHDVRIGGGDGGLVMTARKSVPSTTSIHWNANDLPIGEGNGGLFTLASKINHSCRPNATYHWNTKSVLNVQALVDIEQGDEITIAYVSTTEWSDRRQILEQEFDFVCTCAACSVDDPRRDDAIRAAHELNGTLASSLLSDRERAERSLNRWVELICSHLELRAELPSALYVAFQFACANQDRSGAEYYMALTLKYAALFQGQHNDTIVTFEALNGDPGRHVVWEKATYPPSAVTRLDVEAMIGF